MLKPKKIAQMFNSNGDDLIIWRKEEDVYWVTDTYSIVKFNQQQYQNFRFKWSSYKTKPYIPDLEVEKEIETHGIDFDEGNYKIQTIITENSDIDLEISKLSFNGNRVTMADDINLVSEEYVEVYDLEFNKCKTYKGLNTPIHVYNYDNEQIAVVMPIRIKKEKFIQEINKIRSILLHNTSTSISA